MRKIIFISSICLAFVFLFSCSSRKPYVRYNNKTVNKLSKQFGLRLTSADNIKLYDECSQWLGVKHRIGGNSKKGVDCSGFTSIICKKVYRKDLERNSAAILKQNCKPIKRDNLHEGDLVFFKTSRSGSAKTPSHVGIYLKNGKFVHASTSNGVIVSSLSEPYYVRTWITGGRII
jgi:lipoprotein Spr